MTAETVKVVARPIINMVFIGTTASSFYLDWVEVPAVWMVVTLVCGLEWVSERAIKRYVELFRGQVK